MPELISHRKCGDMIRYLIPFLAFAILDPSFADAADKKKKRPAPVVSPTIHEDKSVTFRIKAPAADKVSVSGEMLKGKIELTKGKDGIWSATTDPVQPGLYGYSFSVDGLKMIDPGNPELKPMRSPKTSVLHIPGDKPYDFQNVPHGTVHLHGYHSGPINRYREMQVYTPPGYETDEQDYPLLVLQHGHGDSYATWVAYGKAHWILDNLIASGKAKPMIVVMLDGHPIPGSYGGGRSPENTEELRKDLMQAALPMVEKLYRVKPGRENRAIAGLSMGGRHSLSIGFTELDTFSMIGAFSAAPPDSTVLKPALDDANNTNQQLRLLWIACGEDDFLLKENQTFTKMLTEAGIDHTYTLTQGGHSWPVWRKYLADFAPLLFR